MKPAVRPQTAITAILNTAEPTMVPIPRSFFVTKVPIKFEHSSGAVVAKTQEYEF